MRAVNALGHPLAPWIVGFLAIVLSLPSLTVGLVSDDWLHKLLLAESRQLAGLDPRPFDLFNFADGDGQRTETLMNTGVFPWWTDRSVKLAFFRPLASMSHWLDYQLWPESVFLMHAQNIAWFGLALLAVWRTYRRFLGRMAQPEVIGLAFLLYALDDAHGPAVGWIANRNAMMSVALGVPVLIIHDRWRRDAWRPGAWLGPAWLLLALGAGEGTFGVCAYLVSYAMCLEAGSKLGKLRSLVGYIGVLIVYATIYRTLGYGVRGSDLYIDALTNPLSYGFALLERLPAVLVGQLAFPFSDVIAALGVMWPTYRWLVAGVSAISVSLVLCGLNRVRRDQPSLNFFALGMFLACVPICGTFPADRLLWFVGIGAMAWIAAFLQAVLTSLDRRFAARMLAALLIVFHLVASPLLLASRSRSMEFVGRPLRLASETLPSGQSISEKTMILINPPADPFAAYFLVQRAAMGMPYPKQVRWLAVGSTALDVRRVDERTLELRQHGGFCSRLTERMLTGKNRRFTVGEAVQLDEVTLVIDEVTREGDPLAVTARFDRRLEDDDYTWAVWKERGFEVYTPPEVGKEQRIEAVDLWESFDR
jgi:hypothetical protein